MIYNIFISLATLLLVFVSSFAMYLPLWALTKNKSTSLRYAIPFSISVEIIIGYFFYSTNTVKYFPIYYLIIAVIVNIWAYYKLKPITYSKICLNWITIVSLFIISAVIVYTRYYDAFKYVGPGGNDAYYHYTFIKDLMNKGYLTSGFYAPGFHLFLMPIAKIVPLYDLSRFAGPVIGIVTVLSFILLMKDYLRNKILLVILAVLLVLPAYNQFSLQTISFFSSSLTFIYFASLIFLSLDAGSARIKTYLYLYLFLFFCSALAITVPYLFVTLIPAHLAILIIVLIFRNNFDNKYLQHLLWINLILILGLVISFGHVYLQSSVLQRYYGFPGIATTSLEPVADTVVTTPTTTATAIKTTVAEDLTETTTSNVKLADKLHLPNFARQNRFLKPMFGSGVDLIRMKNIRTFSGILSIGAYLWIACSIFLLVYAIRKKIPALLSVAVLSISYGLYTQTGLFEMSYYRGRSGWYLLMLSIFGVVLFTDQIIPKKLLRWLLISCVVISITGVFYPPQFYRGYYDEEFRAVSQIVKQQPDRQINIISNNQRLDIIANNIVVKVLKPENLNGDVTFVILEKKAYQHDPVLSQGALSTDKNFNEFNLKAETAKKQLELDNSRITLSEQFKIFNKFFENENIVIYDNVLK